MLRPRIALIIIGSIFVICDIYVIVFSCLAVALANCRVLSAEC